MEKVRLVKIPTHTDPRGSLSVLELRDFIDWTPKRLYYVTGTKQPRGGHAVKGEKKIYICMQGEVKAKIHDGGGWHEFALQGPDDALVMDGLCWRDFTDFSEGAVLCIVSNINYDPERYIYDFEKFLEVIKQQ